MKSRIHNPASSRLHGAEGYCRKPPTALLCVALLLLAPWYGRAQDTPAVEDREIELEKLRGRIEEVQGSLDQARHTADSYLAELRDTELAIVHVNTDLDTLHQDILTSRTRLEQLTSEQSVQQTRLAAERGLLAEQIRVAYKTGRHDFLKLLLNQEDPETVGRMMVWHDYYNEARARRIDEVQITLRNLEELRLAIDSETRTLESLQASQIEQLEKLAAFRDARAAVIRDLESDISDRDRELKSLQQDEQELATLLEDLRRSVSVVDLYENLPPFGTLRGKLRWPVDGRIITRFGARKREDKLRWNGVRISARPGTEVNAVSAGKIIFADWFRNMGLLLIVDHGQGYMSLYGHNERLLKKPGDFVEAGEVIARVGDTGGQDTPALYFEIREQGNPVNPDLWCSN